MKKLLFLLVLTAAGLVAALNQRYGAGVAYPDLTGTPLADANALEVAVSYPEPIGNVALSKDGRLFFTVHPESRPKGNRLLEWVNGAAQPYPDGGSQELLFDSVLGIHVDAENRLWTIDHGNHGLRKARILAFDLDTGDVVHDHVFDADTAPMGSMLQDIRVTADGRHAFIADASIWRQSPAIVVYDIRSRQARRVLESHPSVMPENYLIRTAAGDMAWLGGIVSLKVGVDGLALDAGNDWLYYGAVNQSGVYRVPVSALLDPSLPDEQVSNRAERVADKPLSDGMLMTGTGDVLITDVEHGAVHALAQARLSTLVRSREIRWADGLAFGPDSALYIADSAIPAVVFSTASQIRAAGPYVVYRLPAEAWSLPGN